MLILLDLLAGVQLCQVLTLVALDRLSVKLCELGLGQRDNLVTELRCQANYRVAEQGQVGEAYQGHEHRGDLLLEVFDAVVVEVESDQILAEVERFAVDQVHARQVKNLQCV